jgi:hypothetical protein
MSSSAALLSAPASAGPDLVGHLALLGDRLHDRRAPRLHLAQVGQPLGQRAQLRVVEPAGRLLAVARDEGHRGAAVEKVHRRRDLLGPRADIGGDGAEDAGFGGHGRSPSGAALIAEVIAGACCSCRCPR